MTPGKTHLTIDDLAQMSANEFTAVREEIKSVAKGMVTKKEFGQGISLIVEMLRPMQRDYAALKDDLAPRMDLFETRLTKVEQKIS